MSNDGMEEGHKMSFMMAFGWAGIMLCFGVLLRAKLRFFQNMLVPASVIAGAVGFLFVNICQYTGVDYGTDTAMYTSIVNHLFTISFISISLTDTTEKDSGGFKKIWKGTLALGILWCLLYALTPIIATLIVMAVGGSFHMDAIYGMLVQFAFCQGPGQATAYGQIFEQYGWNDSVMTAITFSAIGFAAAFLLGIPAAKAGINKGLAKHCGKIDSRILKGYYKKEEQNEYMVKDTTCNSNVETLAIHLAIIGVCYILAVAISKILSLLPGFLGSSMENMMFMNGMYAAYIVKALMKKLKINFLKENVLQSKITGFASDYLVVCAFMAISVNVIRKWMIPIFIVSAVITVVTFVICFYFGCRIGGDNDFERTLGLYGTCTGTVPSGISLLRIVDPDFKTTTSVELGACNIVMLLSTPVYILILALASGSLSLPKTMIGLAVCVVIYLGALKFTKSWGSKTYSWK